MQSLPKTLRYSSDSEPGFTTIIRLGIRHFSDDEGRDITDPKVLIRLQALGIPPAYKDVWICRDDHGHLQMTGLDDAGRKQYRYHADWRDFQDAKKFDALQDFGNALPRIRRKIYRDLRREDVDKRFVIAALLRLIDCAAIRVGNQQYTESNGSHGASTLRGKHIKLGEDFVKLDFRAKGGKRVRKIVRDKTLSRVLEDIHDLPGRDVFQYVRTDGRIHSIDSSDVNAYLKDDFTAKTFRTWHGTVAAYRVAEGADATLTLKAMTEAAADRLHNTPSICRTSYIHPNVLELADIDVENRISKIGDIKKSAKRVSRLKMVETRCLAMICDTTLLK
ncbi:MAG: DNA topoisomerase IB [Litorimonas sp.]